MAEENTIWIIFSIIPIAMFFVLFTIFGGFMRGPSSGITETPSYFTETGHVTKEKPKTIKPNSSLVKTILLKVGLAKELQV